MVHPEAPRAALYDASGLRLAGIEPERGRIDAGLASFSLVLGPHISMV